MNMGKLKKLRESAAPPATHPALKPKVHGKNLDPNNLGYGTLIIFSLNKKVKISL
jgi:hypothetical protein